MRGGEGRGVPARCARFPPSPALQTTEKGPERPCCSLPRCLATDSRGYEMELCVEEAKMVLPSVATPLTKLPVVAQSSVMREAGIK